jgi:hypothetical protein
MATSFEIDDSELDEWFEKLEYFENHFPKETRRVMGRVGTKAKNIVKKEAKSRVKKKTGNYLRSIKRGRTFKSRADEWTVRVYSNAPHSHLIERGHRVVVNGKEVGYVKGKNVFKRAGREIESNYHEMVAEEMDKELKKI